MRFGAATWPWKWDGPYDGAVARIGDAGFRATELCAWDDNALENYYTSATLKQLRSILDDKGMVLSQFVVKTPNLSSADRWAPKGVGRDVQGRGREGQGARRADH